MYGCIYTYVYVCIYIYKYVEIPTNRARAHNTRARHKSGSQCLLSEAGRVWYKDGRGMIPGYHKSKRTCANEFMNDMFMICFYSNKSEDFENVVSAWWFPVDLGIAGKNMKKSVSQDGMPDEVILNLTNGAFHPWGYPKNSWMVYFMVPNGKSNFLYF